MKHGAQSEYGKLKTLLLHRPKPEDLRWVREDTISYYNFESPVEPEPFLVEFDGMVKAFADHGVEVVFLTDVLKGHDEALAYISRRPNLVYMRDMATVYHTGAVVMNPHLKGRQWDGWVVAECFRRLGVPILAEIAYPGYLEGGGVGFLLDDIGYVSICDRTTEEAIRQLAGATLGKTLDRLVVVNLPKGLVHIDGLIMVSDDRTAFVHRPILDISPTKVLHASGKVEYVWFPDYLAKLGFEVLDGENGMDLNYVAVEAGKVIGYDFCKASVPALEKRGGTVIGVKGSELVKGNGGVHCMTCPIWRERTR